MNGLPDSAAPPTDDAEDDRVHWPGHRALIAYVIIGIVLVVGAGIASQYAGRHTPTAYTITLPSGTAERLQAGEEVDAFPDRLVLRPGDSLVVLNNDDEPHRFGPYEIAAGERFERDFAAAVAFAGFCSLHSAFDVDIVIDNG